MKKIIIVFIAMLLTGCAEVESNTSNVHTETEVECAYQYTYGCGYDILSHKTGCNYGYYYVCH